MFDSFTTKTQKAVSPKSIRLLGLIDDTCHELFVDVAK